MNDLSGPAVEVYRFGQFVLDPRRRTLSRADSAVFLTPKAFDVLAFLLQNPNRLVTKDELLQAVWGNTFVEEGNLAQYISHLRKALGDNSEDNRLIVTIARKGYQFTGDVVAAGTADVHDKVAVQDPAPVISEPDKQRAIESPTQQAVPNDKTRWWKLGVVSASAAILVFASYMSWRYYRGVTPPRPGKIMLAVLPFENLTGDPKQEYVADGLTEETISQLGRLNPQRLGVIARTSVMGYKNKDERLDQIGRELSVQYVLENSLRKSGSSIRLTAQLIQVKDQTHLWSQDYDYAAKDLVSVEDDVARAVAGQIQLHLTSQQRAGLAQSHTANPEAFDAYLQGYYFYGRNTDKDTDMAAKYFERATQLDPSYALAWVWLSRVRNWQGEEGLIPRQEGRRLSREAIERALALNPNLAAAHAQMARIKLFVDLDWVGAEASIQRAIALDPEDSDIARLAAELAGIFGRFDEALGLGRRAVDLDPLNAESWEQLAETEYFMERLDNAATDGEKALELTPDAWPGPLLLARIYLMAGQPRDTLLNIALIRFPSQRTYMYAIAYYAFGKRKESDAAFSELVTKYRADEPYLIAEVHALRNQPDEAFEWLGRAYASHDENLVYTKVDPFLKNLHNDPRFAAFLKKLNLPN